VSPERVVITGLGVIAPNANGKEAFARALREGKSGVRFQEALRDAKFACQVGGVPQGVDELAKQHLAEDERMAMNSNMVYAALAALEAWSDAGLKRTPPDADDVDWDSGALVGTGFGGIETVGDKLVPWTEAGRVSRLGSTMVEQTQCSGNTARLAGLLALGNQVSTNSSACNTGTEAIVQAFHHVREGRAKRMLAGASEGYSRFAWAGFDAMKVICRTHNHEPEKASRPLSATAAGFVPAAGAGVLLLESLTSARERGARIYAEIIAGFLNCGGHRMGGSMTAPNPQGIRRCIRGAIEMARIRPEAIGAISGHLTATFADPHEIENWSSALGLPPSKMPLIHSTKSLIGHGLASAGGMESVAAILELDRGFVHGSANCEDLHPALAAYAERIPHVTVEVPDLDIVAKASFGFGDVNGCVIFRKMRN
jgi:3-oxoacyl-(acyl-carrier-protein) synthase